MNIKCERHYTTQHKIGLFWDVTCLVYSALQPKARTGPTNRERLSLQHSNRWLVSWELNVPFQHKNRLCQGQGLGWRFSSAKL